jgi:hypothetical protein
METMLITVIVLVVSLGVTVLILALVALAFVPFVRRTLRQRSVNKELLATGVTAPATLISMQQTGMKTTVGVNESWQVNLLLQVQPADGSAFQAQVPHMVSVLEIPQYQPGATLIVRFDPNDRTKVAVLNNLGMLANTVQVSGMDPQAAYKLVVDSEVLETDLQLVGVTAPGQVMAADKVGIQAYGGTAEMMLLTIDVWPAQGAPFRAQTHVIVVQASLPKYQPGARVNVKYDPKDPNRMALVGAA